MHPLNSFGPQSRRSPKVAAAAERMSTAAATFPPPAASADRASSGANPCRSKNEARRRPRPRRRRFQPRVLRRGRGGDGESPRGRHLQALHRRAIMIHPRPGCRLRLRRRLHRPRRRRRRRRFSRGASIGTASPPGWLSLPLSRLDGRPPGPGRRRFRPSRRRVERERRHLPPLSRRDRPGVTRSAAAAAAGEEEGEDCAPRTGHGVAGAPPATYAGCLATRPRMALASMASRVVGRRRSGLRYPRTYVSPARRPERCPRKETWGMRTWRKRRSARGYHWDGTTKNPKTFLWGTALGGACRRR